ncbi:MAG: hypothetical protein IT376_17010 [Polyangiaceae bacterium]|nr:hypothetical protein [Polyangiaceae bacterium]
MRWVALGVVAVAACAPAPPAAPARAAGGATSPLAAPPSDASPPAAPSEARAASSPPGSRWRKGQLHVHSSGSYDAHTPAAEVLRFYAERGYDFVAITDHNRVTRPPEGAVPPGLVFVSGVELTQNSEDCEPAPAPGYRCLFHTTALFVDPERDPARGERFTPRFRPARREAYGAHLALAAGLGGVAVVNHPAFHFAADAPLLAGLAREGLRLVELFNASLDQQHPADRDAAEDRAEALWDATLSTGARVYGLATDDAHHFSDAGERRRQGKFAYVGDRAWVMVEAAKELGALRQALLDGRFHASTGVELTRDERSRELVQVAVRPVPGRSTTIRFVGRGGRVLSEVVAAEATYAPVGDERYVRVVVERDDGAKAWTQPLLLGD